VATIADGNLMGPGDDESRPDGDVGADLHPAGAERQVDEC
jgi:hypothetical protein